MPPIEVTSRLANAISRWHAEFESRGKDLEQSFADTSSAEQRMIEEEKQIEEGIHITHKNFDELLDLLDKEHVVLPSGENLTEENYPKIDQFGGATYGGAMLSLRLQRDIDDFRRWKGIDIPLDSLKRKTRLHFMLAEFYIATGLRIDPCIKDMSARAEYEKVIKEGKKLYEILKEQGNGVLTRARLAHDIGASYKRLFDLFSETEKAEKYGYFIREDGREKRHELIRDARDWYYRMFDLSHELEGKFTTVDLFHTEYEFKRYLRDIGELDVGCVFQRYMTEKLPEPDPETEEEYANYFDCFKTGETCQYNDGRCRCLEGKREQGNALARVEVIRNIL
ncbi:hypothetical protein KY331_02270 [Candidatus Woesearchaeota archaeon]|nr:hypothetical protein [Candidatus Woesearchaeota archaeon]